MFFDLVGDEVYVKGKIYSSKNSVWNYLISTKKSKSRITKWKYKITNDSNFGIGLVAKNYPNNLKGGDAWVVEDINLKICLFFYDGTIDGGFKKTKRYTEDHLEVNDIVVVIFDSKYKNLSYEVNGINKGIAYKNVFDDHFHCCVLTGNSSIEFLEYEEIIDSNVFEMLKKRKLIDFHFIFN